MTIHDLGDGRASLEYDAAQRGAVIASLHALGGALVEQATTYDRWRIDGADLISVSDTGDPCLLAADAQGRRALQRIFARAATHDESRLTATRRAS
ncbi:MAG: hypothetical protein K2X76_07260 [Sphingomonas sp.]|nr:hypothetical protein [Sphingomonas sp.]